MKRVNLCKFMACCLDVLEDKMHSSFLSNIWVKRWGLSTGVYGTYMYIACCFSRILGSLLIETYSGIKQFSQNNKGNVAAQLQCDNFNMVHLVLF